MKIRSLVQQPKFRDRGFLINAARISLLIAIITIIITSLATSAIAGLSDYEKARQYYNKGKYQQAIPLLKKHIKTKPEPDAFFMLGYSLYKLGRHEEARKYFQDSYLVEPEYSPTPDLEKKLNRRLKTARPGPEDYKKAVPQGTLPPEARDLDPTKYKVIDNTSRLKMPETTESTDSFVPAKRKKPTVAKKKSPPVVTAKTNPAKEVVETKPLADKPAPAPVAEKRPVPSPAPVTDKQTPPAPEVATPQPAPTPAPQPAPRPVPGQTPSESEGIQSMDNLMENMPPMPEWLAPLLEGGLLFVVLGALAAGYILLCLPLYIIARKLDVRRPILAFIPIVQNWTLTSAAGLSFIWGLLITIVPFLFIYPIMLVSERLGKGKILGLILIIILGPLGLLILAIIGRAGGAAGAVSAAGDMPNLSGEPELDLPDMDDMGFDMDDDAFASDSGFGSDEGMGAHTDDFGTQDESAGIDDFDMDLEPGEDDFDTTDHEPGGEDDFSLDNMNLGESDSAGGSDEDGFGLDFDEK